MHIEQVFAQIFSVFGNPGAQQPDLFVDIRFKGACQGIYPDQVHDFCRVQRHEHRFKQLALAHLAVEHLDHRHFACLNRPIFDQCVARAVDATQAFVGRPDLGMGQHLKL